ALIAELPSNRKELHALALLAAMGEAGDFAQALKVAMTCRESLLAKLQGPGICEALKRTTKDRVTLSFLDAVAFDQRPLVESLGRLERLCSFRPGTFVLHQTWGLGTIKRIDAFYRRIVIDFTNRHGHQMSYDAACETLVLAPEDHILRRLHAEPAAIEALIRDRPGEFVVEMLKSFGNLHGLDRLMPVLRLEELVNQFGFAKYLPLPEIKDGKKVDPQAQRWKRFWDGARAELKKNELVEIPARRADPIVLKTKVEQYGQGWFGAFAADTDPKSILSSARAYLAHKAQTAKSADAEPAADALDASRRATIASRLEFALTGARNVDDALYTQIVFCLKSLNAATDAIADARRHLLEDDRYLDVAKALPARDMGEFVAFLVGSDRVEPAAGTPDGDPELRTRLYDRLSVMCFPLLRATVERFHSDPECEKAVAGLLKQPHAPATLVAYVIARYENLKDWTSLPPLVVILTHAIALGEGMQSGETLRMQNTIRRLFADSAWLKRIFKLLNPDERGLFFERFQASNGWDPATHHMIVVRMTKDCPELAARMVKVAVAQKAARVTSIRSYAEKQAAYEKLVKVDIPNNTKRIEFAKSYGDLSENAEYQYAKDEQRALLQKQTLMQEDLNKVKAVDFTGVESDAVCAGTMVTIVTAAGEEKEYTILGEWDNDLEKGIISNKAKLAEAMIGKTVGDTFELSDAEGNLTQATIKVVTGLSPEILSWIKTPVAQSV
ncbi:MAG: GreA/GreB family elongation factor, partial [Kiritimatiellia bacterium]